VERGVLVSIELKISNRVLYLSPAHWQMVQHSESSLQQSFRQGYRELVLVLVLIGQPWFSTILAAKYVRKTNRGAFEKAQGLVKRRD
jgi:hypothetical protein